MIVCVIVYFLFLSPLSPSTPAGEAILLKGPYCKHWGSWGGKLPISRGGVILTIGVQRLLSGRWPVVGFGMRNNSGPFVFTPVGGAPRFFLISPCLHSSNLIPTGPWLTRHCPGIGVYSCHMPFLSLWKADGQVNRTGFPLHTVFQSLLWDWLELTQQWPIGSLPKDQVTSSRNQASVFPSLLAH